MQSYEKVFELAIELTKKDEFETIELSCLRSLAARARFALPPNLEQWCQDRGFRTTTMLGVTRISRCRFIATPVNPCLWGLVDMTNLQKPKPTLLFPSEELAQAKCDELNDAWYTSALEDVTSSSAFERNRLIQLLSQLPPKELLNRIDLVDFELSQSQRNHARLKALEMKRSLLHQASRLAIPLDEARRLTYQSPRPAAGR